MPFCCFSFRTDRGASFSARQLGRGRLLYYPEREHFLGKKSYGSNSLFLSPSPSAKGVAGGGGWPPETKSWLRPCPQPSTCGESMQEVDLWYGRKPCHEGAMERVGFSISDMNCFCLVFLDLLTIPLLIQLLVALRSVRKAQSRLRQEVRGSSSISLSLILFRVRLWSQAVADVGFHPPPPGPQKSTGPKNHSLRPPPGPP